MNAFLIQHIDALITTIAGICFTIYSWRNRDRLRTSPKKIVRILPILAPLVLAFGLISFALDSHTKYSWQRVFTADKRASAEFPCATATVTATDSVGSISVKRVTVNCDIPRKGINLRLSRNEIPPESEALTPAQRFEELKTYFQQQGYSLISSAPESNIDFPCYRLTVERDKGQTRCVMRMAILSKAIYRVIATSTAGFHDDPVIERFVDSFNIEK